MVLTRLDKYVISLCLLIVVPGVSVVATTVGPGFERCTQIARDTLEHADPFDRDPPAGLVRLIHEEEGGPYGAPIADRRFDFAFQSARLVTVTSDCNGPSTISLAWRLRQIPLGWWLWFRLGERDVDALYISQAYLGSSIYGFAAAARHYYGRGLNQLDESQQRCLARKLRAPSSSSRRCNGK